MHSEPNDGKDNIGGESKVTDYWLRELLGNSHCSLSKVSPVLKVRKEMIQLPQSFNERNSVPKS